MSLFFWGSVYLCPPSRLPREERRFGLRGKIQAEKGQGQEMGGSLGDDFLVGSARVGGENALFRGTMVQRGKDVNNVNIRNRKFTIRISIAVHFLRFVFGKNHK